MAYQWDQVGQDKPIKDIQNEHLAKYNKMDWSKTSNLPELPKGPEPKPFVLGGMASGGR